MMASKLRAARFRNRDLSLENAISIGFRSGDDRRVRREEEEPGTLGLDELLCALTLVEADIVENDDVTWR
jgi:hypothetical protein